MIIEQKSNDKIKWDDNDSFCIDNQVSEFNENYTLNNLQEVVDENNDNVVNIPYAKPIKSQNSKFTKITVKKSLDCSPFTTKNDKLPSIGLEGELSTQKLKLLITGKYKNNNLKQSECSARVQVGSTKFNAFGKFNVHKSNLESGITMDSFSIRITEIQQADIDKMNCIIKYKFAEVTLQNTVKYKCNKIKLNISEIINLLSSNDVCSTSTSPSLLISHITFDLDKQKFIVDIQLTPAIKITFNLSVNSLQTLVQSNKGLIESIKDFIKDVLFTDLRDSEFHVEEQNTIMDIKYETKPKEKQYSLMQF